MQTRNRNTFNAIHTEGALLPVDLLQRISENNKNLEGLNPESYHLAPGEKLTEAINRSWNRLSGLWGSFQAARGRLGSTDAGTTLTRERWLLPLFQELGFGRLSTSKAAEIEGKSYPISHRWQKVPLHLVGCGIGLDKRTPGAAGASRTSPHSLMQEYLNRSDDVQWGVISNGLSLRILRDNATLTRQAYIEFDLESMFDGEIYSDFVLLWLLCHQSRFETAEKQTECLLEKWSKSAQESGTRALDDLRRGVEEAIVSFGQGFLQHPLNGELRNRLKNGDLSAQDYYRQLLRLVYRLIFLFAAEDRDLLLLPGAAAETRQRFQNYYSTTRLRALAQRQRGSRHHDRYEALRLVMTLLGSDSGCPELAIPALGGFLFDARSTADLNDAKLDNQALLSAVRSLAFITEGNTRRAVDYRNLGPEELGSVYESLLELHPLLNTDAGTFQLTSAAGNERKTTGSYYTPSSLIQVLLDSALDPVIEDRLKGKQDAAQQEQALLELKVCDPACGSGHFLIAAAHRIAGKLAEVRAGDNEPSPNETRRALRDVIRHCIYGVDINPMAVELCKVNLWLESLEPGKPLSFLDAHIKCGNSLVGVGPKMDLSELEVQDEAFNPVTGDHKATAALLKKRNKQEREGQESLFITAIENQEDLDQWLAQRTRVLEAMPEDSAAEVRAKALAYHQVNESVEYYRQRQIADLWTAAFFWKIEQPNGNSLEVLAPTEGQLRRLRNGREIQPGLLGQIEKLRHAEGFFHWPLEFADVVEQKGFDCVIGNPPWEKVKLMEIEFFASIIPEIAQLTTKAEREKAIEELLVKDPNVHQLLEDQKTIIEKENIFYKFSHNYKYGNVGEITTYALFIELANLATNGSGHVGMIIKSSIATSTTYGTFFRFLFDNYLVSFYDFKNWAQYFQGVGYHERYSLITLSKNRSRDLKISFGFQLVVVNDLKDNSRLFSLTANDLDLFSPITNTVPVFNSNYQKELATKIYLNHNILVTNEDKNSWGLKYVTLFHMSNDSHLFTRTDYFPTNCDFRSGRIIHNSEEYLPLYEGKYIQRFDHRFASYENIPINERYSRKAGTTTPDLNQKNNPAYEIEPRYWMKRSVYQKSVEGTMNVQNYYLCARLVTNVISNARSVIACIIPSYPTNNLALLLDINSTSKKDYAEKCLVLTSLFCSFAFDFIVRLKMSENLLKGTLWEAAAPTPEMMRKEYRNGTYFSYALERSFELSYVTHSLTGIAFDLGRETTPFSFDLQRRAVLQAELDAMYFHLYGFTYDEVEYALDTFPIVKKRDIENFDYYKTQDEILRIYRDLKVDSKPKREGIQVGNPDGYSAQSAAVSQKQETILVPQPKSESQPAVVQTQLPATAKPTLPVTPPSKVVKEIDPPAGQPTLTDFGLYKCEVCGKMVMGFEKANHEQEIHGGKGVQWKKMR